MKMFLCCKMAAVLLLVTTSVQGADENPSLQSPQLSPDYAKWRDLILPSPREGSYRTISWRASVLHGVVDAQKNDRPVMIVLMNGHPLGCT